ncbi:hypothetical protein BjapCC829_39795 [Bradyrhizobium barranii]|uniref:Uncharacterized protein n=1 Tax=Bradyrhizobium barranii TaxID=2992140 RepID=A0ABY3QJ05_9BRAD|nr:hypothetical protein [Bradyrhizobium japonicum]UFW85969.1 hypothetical protein BjapCC829_39795 [Bradyrhizobium japonicum]
MKAAAQTIRYKGPKTLDHINRLSRLQADQVISEISYNAIFGMRCKEAVKYAIAGRTGDRAIVPSISEKALPVYFVKDAGLKEQMVQGQTNPLTDTTFVIDAEVQLVDGEPKGYVITHVHRVIEGDV